MNVLLILFGLENAADGWTTYQIIRFGGKEAWVPKFLFDIVGVYWGLLLMKIGIVGWTWYVMLHGGSPTVLAWMEVGYAGVIVWNYLQLLKHKAGA